MADKTIPFKLSPSGGLNPKQRLILLLAGFIALAGIVLSAWFSMTIYVPADAFAVRQVYFGSAQGVQKDVYGPGLQFVIPGYERLHLFPRSVQSLEMNATREPYRRRNVLEAPAIRIQTSEGYQVTVDISVLYRIVDPYKVLTEVGPGRLYETKVVKRRADKILRQTFGRLKAEDFFSEVERIHTAEDARVLLQDDLKDWGIDVWAVLVRHYTYDDRYQQAIEDRKIQDEKVNKNIAEANAATQEAEKNRVVAEGTANIGVERERGEAEVRKILADGDLYYRQKVAEAELLVALAEAEGTKLENAALQSSGASNLVGLKMAEALKGTEVIVISTTGPQAMNPLDLNKLIKGW